MLPQQIAQVKSYVNKRSAVYRQDVAFLVDMKIPSGTNRFFVVNLENDSILMSGLVAHGAGSEISGTDSLQFSNTPNSYMSSLGNYRVANSYPGQFGKAYKLYGLDSGNSNAFRRLIVLHRYSCVPEQESYLPICNSLGCPMVSEGFFPQLEKIIDAEKKSVLLKIYY